MIDLYNLLEGGINKQRGKENFLKLIDGGPVY